METTAVPAAAGPDELLDLAEGYATDDNDPALRATIAAFDARFPDPAALGPLIAGRRDALDQDDWQHDPERVAAVWERAIERLTEAGAEAEAAAVRGRLGLIRCFTGRADEGMTLIRSEVADADGRDDARRQARAWTRLAIAHFTQDEFAEAEKALDHADELTHELPREHATQQVWRARLYQATGRLEEALTVSRSAREFFREHGPASRVAEVTIAIGELAADPEEKLEAYTEALATGVPEAALPARGNRGQLLMHLERPDEAIVDLVEAVALATEEDAPELSALGRQQLAHAYRMAGRLAEAAEASEEALRRFEQLGAEDEANDCRFMLAGLYRETGDDEGALTLYRKVLQGLDDNPAGRGQVGEQAGVLLFDMDHDAEAAELFGSAADALREAGDPIGELRLLRRRVGALHHADDPPAALEVVARAEALYAALPPELAAEPNAIYQRGMIALEIANLLCSRDRYDEVVPLLSGIPERLQEIGAAEESDRTATMLGEALLRTGREAEAERLLREVLDRLPSGAPMRPFVAELHDEARSTT